MANSRMSLRRKQNARATWLFAFGAEHWASWRSRHASVTWGDSVENPGAVCDGESRILCG